MEFPMYFSLVPDPGYNNSYLVSRGIDGEWNLFKGSLVETEDNRTSWTGITWGGLNYSIKGKQDFQTECSTLVGSSRLCSDCVEISSQVWALGAFS